MQCAAANFQCFQGSGIRLFMNRNFDDVEYFGIGPDESYIDKCRAGSHGTYTAKVDDLHEDYLRPQENGSHTDCDYLEIKNKKYKCLQP